MEKAVLGLLKTFVKMLSPSLTRDLYINQKTLMKSKEMDNMGRILQQIKL